MFRPRRSLAATVALLALPLVLGSCSKSSSSSPTKPGTPKELNSGDLVQGGSYQHAFANAGTFPYHCARHSSMTASVTVAGAESTAPSLTL